MDDNDGAIESWPLFLGGLIELGSVGMAIERDLWIHAVVLACLAWLLGRGHPVIALFALVSIVLTTVDIVFLLSGFGSALALLHG